MVVRTIRMTVLLAIAWVVLAVPAGATEPDEPPAESTAGPASEPTAEAPAESFAFPFELWQQLHDRYLEELDPFSLPRDERPRASVLHAGLLRSGAVALTFDDGYNIGACFRIANILRRHDAVGTFFINGDWLRREPARWRRILEGMEVGNHTRSHPDLTREPNRVILKQIRENERIHQAVLGRPLLKLLRPPYGAHNDRVRRLAAEAGYQRLAMWNVDTRDWRPRATEKAVIRRAIGARPGSVILMHCSRPATVRALPAIIRHYQSRGIELAGLRRVLRGAKGVAVEEGKGYGNP